MGLTSPIPLRSSLSISTGRFSPNAAKWTDTYLFPDHFLPNCLRFLVLYTMYSGLLIRSLEITLMLGNNTEDMTHILRHLHWLPVVLHCKTHI